MKAVQVKIWLPQYSARNSLAGKVDKRSVTDLQEGHGAVVVAKKVVEGGKEE